MVCMTRTLNFLFSNQCKAWCSLLTAANKEDLIDAIKDLVDIPPESVVVNYPQSQWSDYLGALGIGLLHRGSILEELRKLAAKGK